jgi:peptidoglycan-N-acetylglucosamine deacetylase
MSKVTLTFDNGPDREVTGRVLDILARRGLRSTFFVLGKRMTDRAERELAERAHREGHWIGNHSFTHSIPLGLQTDPDAPEMEIGRTQEVLGPLSHPDRLFRPFGGGGKLDRRLLSRQAVDYLVKGRFTCVLWNCVPRDWEDPEGWVERALKECAAQPWSLVVLHDLPTGAMNNLDRFLDQLARVDAEIVQDFPSGCVPIRCGNVVLPLDDYIAV